MSDPSLVRPQAETLETAIAFIDEQIAEARKFIPWRREAAQSDRSMTDVDEREAAAMARRMTGRRETGPLRTAAERQRSADIHDRIAEKQEAEAQKFELVRSLLASALPPPSTETPITTKDGTYCPTCYHPCDRCSHCDAAARPLPRDPTVKPEPDSRGWWRGVAQGLGVEIHQQRAIASKVAGEIGVVLTVLGRVDIPNDEHRQMEKRLSDWRQRLLGESAPREGDGVSLIAAERRRQVEKEGWTPEHDDTHKQAEMVGAAINYATIARFIARFNRTDGERFFHGLPPRLEEWPREWAESWWKPDYRDPIRNLVKSGALIAAEIDRLLRVGEGAAPAAPNLALPNLGPLPPPGRPNNVQQWAKQLASDSVAAGEIETTAAPPEEP